MRSLCPFPKHRPPQSTSTRNAALRVTVFPGGIGSGLSIRAARRNLFGWAGWSGGLWRRSTPGKPPAARVSSGGLVRPIGHVDDAARFRASKQHLCKHRQDMRKSLSEILRNGDRETLSRAWDEAQAAEDFAPLPAGEYIAQIVGGELFASRTKGTAGYKLTFRVLEGQHQGRQFWHDVWLTPAALPMAKRDLGKLGVTALEQLERPLPAGIRCTVRVALRKDDEGTAYNRVKSFRVVGIDEPEQDPFAPIDPPGSTPQSADGSAGGGDGRL